MKRAALYMRVSTVDQHPETQLYDLRQMAAQRGFDIVREITDKISSTKARRPGLEELMRDARHGKFDVVLVWACDRIARSTRHFLELLDELNQLKWSSSASASRSTRAARWAVPSWSSSGRSRNSNARSSSSASEAACGGRAWRAGTSDGRRSSLIVMPSAGTVVAGRPSARSPGSTASVEQLCTGSFTFKTLPKPPFRKGPENRPPKPHKIISRISSIRLFHKVWVVRHLRSFKTSMNDSAIMCSSRTRGLMRSQAFLL